MAYSRTTYADGVAPPISAANLNNNEAGLVTADANATTAIANAATAQTTANAAIPKSLVTTAGDILYATASAVLARLGLGAAGTVLKGGASAPSWASIVNADVDAAAAVAGTKISPNFGSQAVTTSGNISATSTGTVTSAGLLTASNALTVTTGSVTVTPFGTAGVVHNNSSGVLSSSTVVDADVSASAAIAVSKLAGGSAGQVLGGTTPAYAYPPGYELDYVQITTNPAGVTATTEGTAATIITGTSQAYDGTKNLLHFFCPRQENITAATTATYVFFRGSTALGQVAVDNTYSGAFNAWIEDTPSASTFSYIVKCFVSGSTQTIYAGAGGSGNRTPAFLRVTKV